MKDHWMHFFAHIFTWANEEYQPFASPICRMVQLCWNYDYYDFPVHNNDNLRREE